MFKEQELIDFFKTYPLMFTDCTQIKSVNIKSDSYNPFDTQFVNKILFDNNLMLSISKLEKKFKVKIGKHSGWIGGLEPCNVEIVILIDVLSLEAIKTSLESHTQLYTLVSLYGTGNVNEYLMVGTVQEIICYAKENGLIHKINEHFKGTFKENYFTNTDRFITYYKVWVF